MLCGALMWNNFNLKLLLRPVIHDLALSLSHIYTVTHTHARARTHTQTFIRTRKRKRDGKEHKRDKSSLELNKTRDCISIRYRQETSSIQCNIDSSFYLSFLSSPVSRELLMRFLTRASIKLSEVERDCFDKLYTDDLCTMYPYAAGRHCTKVRTSRWERDALFAAIYNNIINL